MRRHPVLTPDSLRLTILLPVQLGKGTLARSAVVETGASLKKSRRSTTTGTIFVALHYILGMCSSASFEGLMPSRFGWDGDCPVCNHTYYDYCTRHRFTNMIILRIPRKTELVRMGFVFLKRGDKHVLPEYRRVRSRPVAQRSCPLYPCLEVSGSLSPPHERICLTERPAVQHFWLSCVEVRSRKLSSLISRMPTAAQPEMATGQSRERDRLNESEIDIGDSWNTSSEGDTRGSADERAGIGPWRTAGRNTSMTWPYSAARESETKEKP